MYDGYASPFVKVFFGDKELEQPIEKFTYIYDERANDKCTVTIKTDDSGVPDRPEYQENARIKVMWGYIGGDSVTRIIYWTDLKWVYDKEGVTGTLEGSEKGISLKQTTSNMIHRQASLPAIASVLSTKHGLNGKLEIEIPKKKPVRIPPGKYQSLSTFLPDDFNKLGPQVDTVELNKILSENSKRQTQIQRSNVSQSEGYYKFEKEISRMRDNKQVPSKEFLNKNRAFLDVYQKKFPLFDIPQAGKSDFQTLTETTEQSSMDPYIVDTRDDDLTIKKRNYNQKPIRTLEYKGSDGRLLSFTPETKAKQTKSNTTNIEYGNWDPTTKKFTGGVASSDTSDGKTVLSTYMPKGDIGFIKNLGSLQGVAPSDQVNIQKMVIIKGIDETKTKKIVNGPRGTENVANNLRDQAELKKNPGTALMLGDPLVEVGQLISFSNVGKKNGGNYYTLKSTHDLFPATGYQTTVELARQGSNIKGYTNEQTAKEARKLINKEVGYYDGNRRRRVKSSRNQR